MKKHGGTKSALNMAGKPELLVILLDILRMHKRGYDETFELDNGAVDSNFSSVPMFTSLTRTVALYALKKPKNALDSHVESALSQEA